MHPKFVKAVKSLHPSFRQLMDMTPVRNGQALLEIYCAAVLETPYNDFMTHGAESMHMTIDL